MLWISCPGPGPPPPSPELGSTQSTLLGFGPPTLLPEPDWLTQNSPPDGPPPPPESPQACAAARMSASRNRLAHALRSVCMIASLRSSQEKTRGGRDVLREGWAIAENQTVWR